MRKIKNIKILWKFSDETGNYEVNMSTLAVKAAGCVIALFFVFSILWALIDTAVDEGKYSGDAYHLDWCEREYIDRGYHELYDTLDLYRLTGDKYALYWEMVNGYRDHTLYGAYRALGETGIDEVSYETENGTATLSIPVEKKRVFYGRRVLDNASTCEFEENQRYLMKFADEVE